MLASEQHDVVRIAHDGFVYLSAEDLLGEGGAGESHQWRDRGHYPLENGFLGDYDGHVGQCEEAEEE